MLTRSQKDDVKQTGTDAVVLRTPKQIALARFKRNKIGSVSLFVALFFIVIAFAAPLITRLWGLSPTELYLDKLDEFALPTGGYGGISWQHP